MARRMNPEKQRIKIAKACGWKEVNSPNPQFRRLLNDYGKVVGSTEPTRMHDLWLWAIPDYLNDLNAMHEAEKVLKKSPLPWGQYCNTLGLLCGGAREDDGGIFVSHKEAIDATAAQRAEAFLKTLNL